MGFTTLGFCAWKLPKPVNFFSDQIKAFEVGQVFSSDYGGPGSLLPKPLTKPTLLQFASSKSAKGNVWLHPQCTDPQFLPYAVAVSSPDDGGQR